MTIESALSAETFLGNASVTEFPFKFKAWEGEVEVVLTDPLGVERVVTGQSKIYINNENGGRVIYPRGKEESPLPQGWKITIRRGMNFKQATELDTPRLFQAEVIENSLDRLTAQDQELREQMSRTFKLPAGSDEDPAFLLESIYEAKDKAVESAANSEISADKSCDCAKEAEASADSSEQSKIESAESASEAERHLGLVKDEGSKQIEKARLWASEEEDLEVETGEYSAKHYAEKAREYVSDGIPHAGPDYKGLVKAGGKIGQIYAPKNNEGKNLKAGSDKGALRGLGSSVGSSAGLDAETNTETNIETNIETSIGKSAGINASSQAGSSAGSSEVFLGGEYEWQNFDDIIPLATPESPGLVPAGGKAGQVLWINSGSGKLEWKDEHEVGQYYSFQDEQEREGMIPLLGLWVEDFSQYKEAVKYFESEWGQKRLTTLEDYEELRNLKWHTNAGWEGEGGVNLFVWDKELDRLLVPDLSGMLESNTSSTLSLGRVMGDTIRNATGTVYVGYQYAFNSGNGVFRQAGVRGKGVNRFDGGERYAYDAFNMDLGRQVPTGEENAPKRWGARFCVCLGSRSN